MAADASWLDALPDYTPASPPALASSPGTPPSSFPIVSVHPAPDGSGGWTNLSDEDYAKFQKGVPGPATKPDTKSADASWLDNLPDYKAPPTVQSAARSNSKQSTINGMIANAGAGTSETLASAIGAPVDLAAGALNLIPRGINAMAGTHIPTIQNPIGGSEWAKSAMGLIGADPRQVETNGTPETLARAAGAGAASMLVPWAGARALPALTGIPGALQEALGSGSATGQAITGAAAGATGQATEDQVPQPYKPLANMAGQIVGGGLTGALGSTAKALGSAVADKVSDFIAPMGEQGQKRIAAQTLFGPATDLQSVRETLDNPPLPLVPGSEPTTFQLTGDQGLGAVERAAAKNNPEAFLQRANEQNAARVGAVQGLQATGDPNAVGTWFRGQLADADAADTALRQQIQQRAQAATTATGGNVPADASALQHYGSTLQSGLNDLNQAAKARVSRLYDAIDDNGRIPLALDMSDFRGAVKDIVADRPKAAKPLTGEAQAIFGTAQMQPKVQSFREVAALRSRIGDAMREAAAKPELAQEYRQLALLRNAVDETMSGAVTQRAADEAQATASGAMAPEQSIVGRIINLQQEADKFVADRRAADIQARRVPGEGAAGYDSPGMASGVRGAGRAASDAGGQYRQTAGSEGLSGSKEELTPNFDEAALARKRAADAAHRERMQTFGPSVPGVGRVLAQGQSSTDLKMPASQVPAELFTFGKSAPERIQAFKAAASANPALTDTLQDYAAYSFRRAAEDADGTINPAKADRWLKQHAEAMTEFPDLGAKFRDAATARQTLDDVAVRQQANRADYETDAVRRLIGDADPVKTVGRILNSDTSVAQMQDLARKTAGAPEARAGLRRAVVEHILDDLRSNALAGDERAFKNDRFQTFARKTSDALGAIFSPAEVQNIQNVAADLQRAQRSYSGTKLPGGSNTAQDLAAGARHAHGGQSVLSQLITAEIAGDMAHGGVQTIAPHGGLLAHVAGTGTKLATVVINAMRQAGFERVDQLVTEAALNPGLAKVLLSHLPKNDGASKSLGKLIADRLKATSAVGAATSQRDYNR